MDGYRNGFFLAAALVVTLFATGGPGLGRAALESGSGGTNAGEKVVTAGEFVLVDPGGRRRGALHMTEDGRPRLDLYDSAGRARAGLYLLADGAPRLALFGEAGIHRALFAMLPGGRPGLFFFDRNGTPAARMLINEDGRAGLVLGDKDGNVLWSAP